MITHHCSDCGDETPDGNNLCHPTAAVDSVRHPRLLWYAYQVAQCAADQAEQVWFDGDDDDTCVEYHGEDCQHPALLGVRAAHHARDVARRAWIDSDEPKTWELIEGSQSYATLDAPTIEDAIAQAEDWVREGDYHVDDHTVWVDVRVRLVGAPDVSESTTVTLHPLAPRCVDGGREHDWRSPYSVVGGDRRNPGVWGSGGGVLIREVCSDCGAYRITDTWAQRPDTGESGLTGVSYTDPDEASLACVAEHSGRSEESE